MANLKEYYVVWKNKDEHKPNAALILNSEELETNSPELNVSYLQIKMARRVKCMKIATHGRG